MISNKIFKSKSFIVKHKRKIATALVSFILGSFSIYSSTLSKEEYETYLPQLEEAQSKLKDEQAILNDKSAIYTDLLAQKNSINTNISSLDDHICSLNNEITSKEYDKKAKEEAERKAHEEAQRKAEEEAKREAERQAEAARQAQAKRNTTTSYNSNQSSNNVAPANNDKSKMVWRTKSGKKYHSTNNCGNTDSSKATQVTIGQAQSSGLSACSKCY